MYTHVSAGVQLHISALDMRFLLTFHQSNDPHHKPQAAKVRMQLMCLCNIVFCSATCLHSHDTVAHELHKASLTLQRAMDLHLRVPPERWGLTRCEFHAFVQEALETRNQRQQCANPRLFWGAAD